RAAREAGQPTLELAQVSASLATFCLRAVGAKEPTR
ncbi:MAG: TetR family transcriptional regulator, partial [Ectopseudomonas oleovorans]